MSKTAILAIYERARNAGRFVQHLLSSAFEDLLEVESRMPFLDPVSARTVRSVRNVIWAVVSTLLWTLISMIVGGASYSLKRLAELLHDDFVGV